MIFSILHIENVSVFKSMRSNIRKKEFENGVFTEAKKTMRRRVSKFNFLKVSKKGLVGIKKGNK